MDAKAAIGELQPDAAVPVANALTRSTVWHGASSQVTYHGSFLCSVLASRHTYSQHGCAAVAHDGLHVSKIHVDQARYGDDV